MAPRAGTATVSSLITPVIVARQATTTIVQPSGPTCSGQYSGGTLAGAILGTFFGTLLIIYLFNTILNNPHRVRREEVITERKVRSNGSRRRRSRSGSLSSVRRPSRVYSTRD